jgi:hypothetical protein
MRSYLVKVLDLQAIARSHLVDLLNLRTRLASLAFLSDAEIELVESAASGTQARKHRVDPVQIL